MKIKSIYTVLILACISGSTVFGMASRKSELSLIVFPERHSVAQVAFDLADKRNCVLVTYRMNPDEKDPILNAWNGSTWVPITLEKFTDASYLRVLPKRTILVGDETLLPPSLIDGVSWCPQVWQVSEIHTDGLVNSLGSIFKFRQSEWEWFAGRYSLDLEDQNEAIRKDSWYFHPYIETPKPGKKQTSDLAIPEADEEIVD